MTTALRNWIALALGTTVSAAPLAVAQAQQVDTSDWACELCPFADGHDGRTQAGATGASDDSAYFGDATGYDESGAYGNLDGRGSYTGDAYFMRWTVEDLLLDSRALKISGSRPGRFDYRFAYSELPRREFITTRTVFRDAGGASLVLPDDWVRAAQTTGFTALAGSLYGLDIASDRSNFLAGGSYRLTPAISASVDYRRHENKGNRILGGSFYTTSSLLPAPFDYVTDEVELTVDYAGERAYAALGWYLSDFSNDTPALTWESPFTTIPGAETPALAQAPDSRHQQLSVRGGYVFDFLHTSISASAAVGEITQDSAFLPYTTNTLLAADALPRPDLDGSVDTSHFAAALTMRPLPRARIKLGWRYDERDNNTDRVAWNRVIVDSFVSGASELNTPYSFERSVLDARGSYSLFDNLTFEGGVERREIDRDFQEVAEQTEDTGWLGIRWQPLSLLALDVRGGTAKRDIDRYDETVAASFGQNPLLRKYNLAYRYREFADFSLTLTPAEWPVSLAVDGLWADDSYTQSRLGLLSGDELQLAADFNWTISDKVSWYLSAGFDNIESTQAGSESFGEPDWQADWKDEFVSVGTGLRIRQIADKVGLTLDYRESDSTTEIVVDSNARGNDPFPDFETFYKRARATVDYRWSERLLLEFGLTWQAFETRDWSLQGVYPATIPAVLSLDANPWYEEQVLFALGFRYDLGAVAATEE
jgi:MtrB/PioB family decaheme-associated outer membrane protein